MTLFSDIETQKINSGGGGGDRKILDTDTYVVSVVGFVDLGTQHISYQGEEKDERRFRVIMEVDGEEYEDGNPFTTHLDVKDSCHEKSTMTKVLLAANRGDTSMTYGQLLDSAVGKSFRVQIDKKVSKADREYNRAKPATICALSKREKDVVMQSTPIMFSLKAPSLDTFTSLTKWTVMTIMDSPEGQALGREFHEHHLSVSDNEASKVEAKPDTSALE
jgi:hypothetical protein